MDKLIRGNLEMVVLYDGKYIVVLNKETGEFKALRYGHVWRNLCGDNLILQMFLRIQELQEELEAIREGREKGGYKKDYNTGMQGMRLSDATGQSK